MSAPEEQPPPAQADASEGSPAGLPQLPAIDIAGTYGLPRALQRRNWTLSVGVAALTHFLMLFALWPRLTDGTGVGGGGLSGIEVDIVSVGALEALTARDRGTGTEAEVAIFGGAGAVNAVLDQEAKDDAEARQRRAELPEPEPVTSEPTLLKSPEQREDSAAAAPAEPTENALAGAVAAPGAPGTAIVLGDGEGLSPGVVQRYKGEIVQRLDMHKPSIGVHAEGEVVIEFTIIDTGEVGTARIASSSGHKLLDEAALTAVQTTRFPAPPRGISPALLTYRIPYYFRPPIKR